MDDIKEKLLTAAQDGALDAAEVVEQLLMYIDADTVQDIVEKEGCLPLRIYKSRSLRIASRSRCRERLYIASACRNGIRSCKGRC